MLAHTIASRCSLSQSPGRACRAAGVPAKTGDDPYRYRAEHALHAGTHMAGSDNVPGCPAGTVPPGRDGLPRSPDQRSPGHSELLPVADLAVGHVGDRDAASCRKPPRGSPELRGYSRSRSNQVLQSACDPGSGTAPGWLCGRRQRSRAHPGARLPADSKADVTVGLAVLQQAPARLRRPAPSRACREDNQ